MSSRKDFFKSFKPAINILKKHISDQNIIHIITHNDADGVAAGGVLSNMVLRMDMGFKITTWKRVEEKYVKDLANEDPKLVLFSDLGSGYLDILGKYLQGSDIIVLDHHLAIESTSNNIIHCNPLLHEIDGSRGVSGAGVAYFLAKAIDKRNTDLSQLGIIGALADQQDKGPKKSLLGLNKIIESDAKKRGLLETNVDLVFYGYETRPIAKACAYTTTPFIPGLSGREDRCLGLLKEADIKLKDGQRWRALRDLSEEEKRNLFSALTKHMIYEGVKPEMVHQLVGTIYTLKKEKPWTPLRDAREYASTLNACARMGRSSLGLAICLGDRSEAMREAEVTVDTYRQKIGEYLAWVRINDRIKELENIYVMKAEGAITDTIVGVVASILLTTGILKKQKPFIASAHTENGLLKISARGTLAMAERGLDLGEIMLKACEKFEGRGGGHDLAAGAYILVKDEDNFLRRVNSLIGKQIS